MKLFRNVIILLIASALALATTGYFEYRHVSALDPHFPVFSFNDQQVTYTSATVHTSLLWGLYPLDLAYHMTGIIRIDTDQILNHLSVDADTQVTMTSPDQSIQSYQGSQDLTFEENGVYTIDLISEPSAGTHIEYEFFAVVNASPLISVSNLSPAQGDVLSIDISNLKSDSDITVKSPFGSTIVLQTGHSAHCFIPIDYKATIKTYPLNIIINGVQTDFTLSVAAYDFEILHFTVDQNLLDATTGNPLAVTEYKNAIYPTYSMAEPVEYWTGNFIIPVIGAHISSTFGEIRYINDSTNPSRHSGLDYGVSCGTDIAASNAGKIDFAGFLIMTGNTVVIDHGLGLKTYYEHMESLSVSTGDLVEQGQLIGKVGKTGVATGCHLHFQAMIMNRLINPDSLYNLVK